MNQHRLRIVLVAALTWVAAMLIPSAASHVDVVPLTPVPHPDGLAGVCYSFYPGAGNRAYLPLVRQAGSRWDRFDFSWSSIEPSEGTWRFDGHDALIRDLSEFDIDTIGILLWTPDWAAARTQRGQPQTQSVERPTDWYAPSLLAPQSPSNLSASPPQGLYEQWDDWTTADGDPINYWGRYVHTVVSRYSDPVHFSKPVKHWEMWNEVDDGVWNYFWTGSEEDYARLLQVGYLATKDACPDCTVLYGGLLYWADPEHFERVLAILKEKRGAAAHNGYFDVMSVHLYSRSSTVYDTIERIRAQMTKYVADRPIWLTETGVPVWDDESVESQPTEYDFAATQEEAAAYVIQTYANGWASGIERYLFFRANDEDMNEHFGLMRNDRSLRPSYVAYQVATRYLISPTMVTHWSYTDGVRRVTLWGTPHGKVSVLWNQTPQTQDLAYAATLTEATVVDQRGGARTMDAAEGTYRLELPGTTANLVSDPEDYFIGGEPLVIIEEDTVPPSEAVLAPLPATTYSDTIPISWTATDDRAGVWGVELQVRQGWGGDWSPWLGLRDTAGKQWAAYSAEQHHAVYCFRGRAWDRAGNPGLWSTDTPCTRTDLEQDVVVRAGPVFGDENGDRIWDLESEQALANVEFRLLDPSGSQLAASSGPSWEMQTTLRLGTYQLSIVPESWPSPPPGWLPRTISIAVTGGEQPLSISESPVGLLPHRSSSYLPLIALAN